MKKICTMAVVMAALTLLGCGAVSEPPSDFLKTTLSQKEDTVTKASSLSDDFEGISQEDIDAAPDLSTITKPQLLEMSVDELRAFVAKVCPNFREVFRISEDTAMDDDQWDNLRLIISFELFGSIREDASKLEEPSGVFYEEKPPVALDAPDEAVVITDYDFRAYDYIFDLDAEGIASLGRSQLAGFVNELFLNMEVEDPATGETPDAGMLSDSDLEDFRAVMLTDIEGYPTLREAYAAQKEEILSNPQEDTATASN